ncbi:hypothetical protein Y032_0142g2332 [Ancylostoma ceylanicum]|uniref:Uncharacterized protein n=1 Tax=Ancylostoma ceylanicum TaxID=53326 RepID=A0A016T3G7_9BILA|nr:hypothetical protein Y032_0142g2332 [Ancylostoma ceylanicum]
MKVSAFIDAGIVKYSSFLNFPEKMASDRNSRILQRLQRFLRIFRAIYTRGDLSDGHIHLRKMKTGQRVLMKTG